MELIVKNMELKKISDYEWEIPKQGKMNVPVRIFASVKLLEKMKEDLVPAVILKKYAA